MENHMTYEEELHINEKNAAKRIVKKFVRFCLLPFIKPYIAFQNQVNELLEQELQETRQELHMEMQNQKKELAVNFSDQIRNMRTAVVKETDRKLDRRERILSDHIGAAARQIMSAKWREIDRISQKKEKQTDILTCSICGWSQERGQYETRETDCIFNGGHLVRYICPKCGVIFGPTKFTDQGPEAIEEDYKVHYLGFSEGDSSAKEERAFFMLHPDKKSVYLNYGCGHWSKSLQNLREQGYQVYGYEPYSPDVENPYMITDREALSKMRFDGIYSNDLMEHLLDPIEELKFMKRLLLSGSAKMSHSTACYAYKHEYTRFHTHFFTGSSVKIMSEKSGLDIVDYCNALKKDDFICYVFADAQRKEPLLKDMFINENGERDAAGNIRLRKNGILFGPYLTLAERAYELNIKIRGAEEPAALHICSCFGKEVLAVHTLKNGDNKVNFIIETKTENVEFVIESAGEAVIVEQIDLC